MSAGLSSLSRAEYGKTNVRVFRIVRDGKWHHVVEYNVTVLLQGDISTSYTQADNSVVVATDSMKNIIYYIAKISPHILSPEKFALHLGTFIVSKYAHIENADVKVEQLRWKRILVPGKQQQGKGDGDGEGEEHSHAFWRDGEEKRVVKAIVDASKGKDKLIASVSAGISDLLVLKSTGSAFTDFIQDEFTTLIPVDDRIFSTSIDLTYTFQDISIASPKDEKKLAFEVPVREGEEGYHGSVWDEDVFERTRKATVEVFAMDESASVQATLYKMGQRIIDENGGIREVSYALPNKHYIPVDMRYIGVDNLTPAKAEVFCPIGAPSGLISATISRK